MKRLLNEIGRNRLLWGLVFVPILFVCHWLKPESHTFLFILSVLAVVPLAALLSLATESVAHKTGDTVSGCSTRPGETWGGGGRLGGDCDIHPKAKRGFLRRA